MNKTPFKVVVYEMERGWGRKVDDVIYFQNPTAAKHYVKTFNSRNNESSAPDWYMYAEYYEN